MADRAKSGRRGGGMSPAKAGIIAIIIIVILTFEGFTRLNPFRSPFEMKATFNSVNNLQQQYGALNQQINTVADQPAQPATGHTVQFMNTGRYYAGVGGNRGGARR